MKIKARADGLKRIKNVVLQTLVAGRHGGAFWLDCCIERRGLQTHALDTVAQHQALINMYWMTKHIRLLIATAATAASLLLAPAQSWARPEAACAEPEVRQWPYELPRSVAKALGRGDVAGLSPSIGQSVELRLPNGSGVYSKKQAEMILSDFFSTHSSTSYSIDREEKDGLATLTIGLLQTSKGTLRLSILSQKNGGSFQIKQFRIEEQK